MGEQDSKDKVLIVEKRLIMNSVGEIIETTRLVTDRACRKASR